MKIRISKEDDALYLRLNDAATIIESEEVESGIILDFDAEGEVVGIEVLRVSERSADALESILLQTA
ncbi:MAG: DUF2283 domain-containing protein [Candidatus Kapabacteria bacterium]|jgi:uncharacterized protein YuzE|nr:DUF2283 domain-containing protein [Candidatus Kapabacteria bacterium]